MVAIPVAIPDTCPEELTVAIVGELLPHVPPLILLLKLIGKPTQTAEAPEIVPALASGFTITFADAEAVPQPVVNV